MIKNKYFIISVLVVIVLIVLSILYFRQKSSYVKIKNQNFSVEIAQTEEERNKGLSGRDHLDNNSGMLFIWPDVGIYSFWMQDTLIPLDIIFIDNNKIVEMTTLPAQTDDNIAKYTPENKAQYVLELNAGEILNNNFHVGDVVKIKI